MGLKSWLVTKLNPAQPYIAREESKATNTNTRPTTTAQAYKSVELMNRGVNMLVDSAAQVDYSVDDKLKFTALATTKTKGGIRKEKLHELLNIRPNPYMDASTFRRLIMMDFVMLGWAFIHWDGNSLYHVPASGMEVTADSKHYVNHFTYNGTVTYAPNEIIFIKDNAFFSTGVTEMSGQSRVFSCLNSVVKREELLQFKQNFYKNGALFSLVVETDAVISKRLKQRFQDEVSLDYNPRTGKSSVLVLDGGMKAKSLTPTSTKDLDVSSDITSLDKSIMVALGIPPLLLDSGNNANIRPNIDLFYYMTVLPLTSKFQSAFQVFFGYEVILSTKKVAALTPDKESEAKAIVSQVNNGIITGNEGRQELRYDPITNDPAMDSIRIPQNIAGSATGVSGEEGGKPAAIDEE